MYILKYDYLVNAIVSRSGLNGVTAYIRVEDRNKMLYYSTGDRVYSDPRAVILGRTEHSYILPSGTKLHFSPKSKMPRDYVRSTHKIVREPRSADFVVIPDLTDRMETVTYQILFSCTKGTYTLAVKVCFDAATLRRGLNGNITVQDIVSSIVNRMDFGRFLSDSPVNQASVAVLDSIDISSLYNWGTRTANLKLCWSVPSLPEYEDILMHQSDTKYIFDTDVTYDTATKLTAEMLYVQRKNRNKDIVLRSLAATDWENYPVTTAVFLFSYFKNDPVYDGTFPSMTRFMASKLNVTVYTTWANYLKKLNTMLVSPEDISLLQEWLFMELHLDSNCGYIDFDTYASLPTPMRDCLRKKMAVSKMKTTEPIMLQDLKQSC